MGFSSGGNGPLPPRFPSFVGVFCFFFNFSPPPPPERGLIIVLFLGFFSLPPPENFSADALGLHGPNIFKLIML